MADRTEVEVRSVNNEADTKEDQATALKACAGAVGVAGAVAVAMNPGSMAAMGAVGACGIVGAFLVGNSEAVERNGRQLRATADSFAAAHEQDTAAAGGLVDTAGTGIARTERWGAATWQR